MNHAFQKNSSAIRSCQILRSLRHLNPIIHPKKEDGYDLLGNTVVAPVIKAVAQKYAPLT